MSGNTQDVVELIIEGKDEYSDISENVRHALGKLADEAKDSRQELDRLEEALDLTATYRKQEAEVERLANAQAKARIEVDRLTQANKEAKGGNIELVASLAKTKAEFGSLRTSTNKAQKAFDVTKESMRQQGVELTTVEKNQIQYRVSSEKLAKKLTDLSIAQTKLVRQAREEVEVTKQQIKAKDEQATATSKLSANIKGISPASLDATGSIAKLTRRIIALGGTYLGINALKKALVGIVNTGAEFEQLDTQITTLMGSIEAGETATAWIKDFATKTPTDLAGVTEGFIKLKAFGIDPMNGSYQAIVDQTSKLGFSQEKMEGVILAVGQAWTKQKLQGEEALQLIERGVPVWDLLSKATGRTAVELQALATKGKLGRKEIKLLIDEMGRGSEGAAASQMSTWNGLISNLTDSWNNFVNEIADAGVFEFAKEQLRSMLDLATRMAKDGSLSAYAKQISDYIVIAGTEVKNFVTDAVTNFDTLVTGTQKTVAGFSLTFNAFTAGISTIVAAVTGGLQIIHEAMAKAADTLGLDWLADKYQKVADGLGDVSRNAVKQIEQDAKDINAAWDTLTGNDFSEAKARMSELARASQETTVKLISDFESIVNSADATSEDIRNAFLKGLDTAKTQAEIEQLAGQFSDLGAEGRVSADHIVQGLELVSVALDKITSKADNVTKAVNGITTSTQGIKDYLTELDKIAESQQKKTAATKADTDAVTGNTKKIGENTESVRANRGAALTLAGKTAAAWDAASEQMGAAYDRLTQGMANAVDTIGDLPRAAFAYVKDFAAAYWDAEKAAVRMQAAYDQQQQSLAANLRRLTESEQVTEDMVKKAEQALSAYNLLGEEQLSPLRNAISAIKADMDSLTDSLESTVDGLQDELDRLNGDAVSIEERAYQKKRDALEAQAVLANKQNNKDATAEAREALRLLEQTYQIKRQQAQEIERNNAQSSANNNQATNQNIPTSNNRTITIEMGGQSRTVNVADVSSESELISLLEDLQAVNLG